MYKRRPEIEEAIHNLSSDAGGHDVRHHHWEDEAAKAAKQCLLRHISAATAFEHCGIGVQEQFEHVKQHPELKIFYDNSNATVLFHQRGFPIEEQWELAAASAQHAHAFEHALAHGGTFSGEWDIRQQIEAAAHSPRALHVYELMLQHDIEARHYAGYGWPLADQLQEVAQGSRAALRAYEEMLQQREELGHGATAREYFASLVEKKQTGHLQAGVHIQGGGSAVPVGAPAACVFKQW